FILSFFIPCIIHSFHYYLLPLLSLFFLFFFNAPPPTEIYTLSLHDALPIYFAVQSPQAIDIPPRIRVYQNNRNAEAAGDIIPVRSEEHTSELQSRSDLVCRLLLEKKKKKKTKNRSRTRE